MPTFLTALPKDEQVTGSRDPLGLLPLWSELGRKAIANVTTVSSDMAGWVTLALGALETRELVGDDDDAFLGTFLMVEQAVAYARCADKNERTVRGSNEVRRRLQRGNRQVLGADRKRQILVGQQTTGVWGQVSRPGRRSRLLDENSDRLTDDSYAVVDTLLEETLGLAQRRRFRACVTKGEFALDEQAELVASLQALHAPRPTGVRKALLREKVLYAGGIDDPAVNGASPSESGPETLRRQRALVGLLKHTPSEWRDKPFATAAVLREKARAASDDPLADWLLDVIHLEQLLGPLERLFRYLLVPSTRTISEIGEEVGTVFESLPLRVREGLDVARGLASAGAGFEHIEAAQEAISGQDWPALIVAVVERNKAIMGARTRGAWIRRAPGDRLEIDLGAPDDGVAPSLPGDLEGCWTHGFYLPELHRLVAEIEGLEASDG